MTNKTPEIRFNNFYGDWERRKLSNYKDVRDGTHDSPKYHQSGHPLVTSKNLKSNGLDMTDISLISTEDFDAINKRSKVDKGDILFGMIGTIGNPVIVDRDGFAIKNVALIKDGGNITNRFLIQLLKSPIFDKYIRDENVGNTQKFIGLNKIREFHFLSPIIEEQNKISLFLKKLDDTLALHQREVELLKKMKQGFLQKMFPQKEEKVPEVRFTNFYEEWEQRKLGEAISFLNGKAYKQQELLDEGKYRVLRVGNFNTNDKWYYSDLELDDNKYAVTGDLLYLWATDFKPAIWTEERVIYHYHIWKLQINDNQIDKQYLYTWLMTDKERIKQTTNGTTMVHVTKGGMEERPFQLPSYDEQQKIGIFFKQLDKTIAHYQNKIEKLKMMKKAFLQKMFV